MATSAPTPMKGLWWKFSSYQIQGGSIVPSPDATLEWYDPWDYYNRAKRQNGKQPPYQSLFALVASINRARAVRHWLDHAEELPDGAAEKISHWCGEFGLLGLLPHKLRRIQKLPRLAAGREDWVWRGEYERVGNRWVRDYVWYPANPRLNARELRQTAPLGEFPKPGRRIPKDHSGYDPNSPAYESPHVYLSEPLREGDSDLRLRVSSLPSIFFPGISAADDSQFDCPLPGTQEFAQSYAEPLGWFIREAFYLYNAGSGLLSADSHDDDLLEIFEKYLQPVALVLESDTSRKLRECWSFPSLLCSFAKMIVQDASEGRDLRTCACCGTPFLAERYQTRYCSTECGWKHRKRRARAGGLGSQETSNGQETRKQ